MWASMKPTRKTLLLKLFLIIETRFGILNKSPAVLKNIASLPVAWQSVSVSILLRSLRICTTVSPLARARRIAVLHADESHSIGTSGFCCDTSISWQTKSMAMSLMRLLLEVWPYRSLDREHPADPSHLQGE